MAFLQNLLRLGLLALPPLASAPPGAGGTGPVRPAAPSLPDGPALLCAPTLFHDCNANGVEDAVDIARGTSCDANLDGIPDECQARCEPATPLRVVIPRDEGNPLVRSRGLADYRRLL